MKKKANINIYDVAKVAGVSISTVSRALNDDPRISPTTKDKVRIAARNLGFQKNALASGLSTNQTKVIGVMVSQLNREFLASLVRSMEETAFNLGYSVIICQTNNSFEREKAYVDTLISSRVAGIIVTLSLETTTFDHFKKAKAQGIPIVMVDRVTNELKDTTKIVIDDFQAAYEATKHLIGKGYRKIAYVSGPVKQLLYQNRLNGYRQALKDTGLPLQEEWEEYTLELTYEEGSKAAEKLLQLKNPPDAILTANNLAAISTIAYAQEKGIHVPAELGVLGFSEEPFSAFMRPSVTSVRQPSNDMGSLAVKKLIEEINAERKEDFIYQKITLSTQLIERDSTQRTRSPAQSISK